jgi:hypothetical protein
MLNALLFQSVRTDKSPQRAPSQTFAGKILREVNVMKIVYKILASIVGVALFAATLNTHAADGHDETYACQVQATGGRQGLVLLQTHNREEALTKALNLPALTIDGSTHASTAIVECVLRPNGKFSDGGFQRFYANVPL